jgi:hypothetical protein
VENGKVVGWYTGWRADRPFAIDMAGEKWGCWPLCQMLPFIMAHQKKEAVKESGLNRRSGHVRPFKIDSNSSGN